MSKYTLVVSRPLIVAGNKVAQGTVLGHITPVGDFIGRDIDKALQLSGLRIDQGDIGREAAELSAKNKKDKSGEPAPKKQIDPEKLSLNDLKKELKARKIDFGKDAKYPELVELLKKALQPAA